jgi:pyruvate,orthophosphate dikinase
VKLARVASKPSEILQVVSGALDAKKSDLYRRFNQLLSWSDKHRRMGVRANADLPDQAKLAYAFGARGIGLCRTEHMFFGEERLPIVQRMIPTGGRRSMSCCRCSATTFTGSSRRCAASR